MLDQHEYGVAMLLVLFFFVIGIGAAMAITRKTIRLLGLSVVVVITSFSVIKIWTEKGTRHWSTIFQDRGVSNERKTNGAADDRRQRKITEEQSNAMIAILERAPAEFKERPGMTIVRIGLENESALYAQQIVEVIRAAGWKVEPATSNYPREYYLQYRAGITILVSKDGPQSPMAKTLSEAFTVAGIHHVIDTGLTFTSDIVLIIGTKGSDGSS